MNILGVSSLYHDSAACLVNNGNIIAAVQEERFTRIKHDSQWPVNAIRYCSEFAGKAFDYAAFYEDPVITFDRVIESAINNTEATSLYKQAIISQLSNKAKISLKMRNLVAEKDSCFFIQHHTSHASSAYYPSGFSDAAVLVVDAVGEWACTSIFKGKNGKLQLIESFDFPNSLGLLYSAFTVFCGFKANSGEYKLMGLAPFGEPIYYQLILDNFIEIRTDGSYLINDQGFAFQRANTLIDEKLNEVFGFAPRKPESVIDKRYADVAASIQKVLNESMLALSRRALGVCESKNLCLAGGVALNCVTNTYLFKNDIASNIWVQPAAGDAGGAVGAALYTYHNILDLSSAENTFKNKQPSIYLGPEFTDDEIKVLLNGMRIEFDYVPERSLHHHKVATLLSEKKIVGRFFGRMEFGPRALGARSILGDPRDPAAQKNINKKIKFRESWRPFAPSVLEECADEWFNGVSSSPYMLFTAQVKSFAAKANQSTRENSLVDSLSEISANSDIPAVTHVDGSARFQTVNKENNADFHALIKSFQKITGCPVLVNTSFNVRGEPMVCSPLDAVNCFFNCEMDILSIGPFIIYKDKQSPALINLKGKSSFHAD